MLQEQRWHCEPKQNIPRTLWNGSEERTKSTAFWVGPLVNGFSTPTLESLWKVSDCWNWLCTVKCCSHYVNHLRKDLRNYFVLHLHIKHNKHSCYFRGICIALLFTRVMCLFLERFRLGCHVTWLCNIPPLDVQQTSSVPEWTGFTRMRTGTVRNFPPWPCV